MPRVNCPVDDCGQQFGDHAGLRAHVNATEDHPDWSTVVEKLNNHVNQEKSADSGDVNEASEEENSPVNEGKAGKNSAKSTENQNGDMPTDDEYQRFHDTDDQDDDVDPDDDQDGDPPGLPVDTGTAVMVVGLVIILVLATMYLRSGAGSATGAENDEAVDEDLNAGEGLELIEG